MNIMFKTDRKVTPLISHRVLELSIPMNQLFKLHKLAVARYFKEGDVYYFVQPDGNYLIFTDGKDTLETLYASDYPNVKEKLYIIIEDHGKESVKGLVAMIMLPTEL